MNNRKNLQLTVMLWLILTVASLVLTSCDVGDFVDDPQPSIMSAQPVITTMIRFENAEGDNLMSSVEDIRRDVTYYHFQFDDVPWLDVRCIRGSDGAQMTYSTVAWHHPSDPDEIRVFGTGPVLILSWLDVDKLAGQNVTFPARDSYTLHILNTHVWPEAEEHTVMWNFEFPTRYTYSVVSCAVDGVDSPQFLSDAVTDSGRFIGLVSLRLSH